MKKIVVLILLVHATAGLADILKDALKLVPEDWLVDREAAVIDDFNNDGSNDIALSYYEIDPDAGELNNRRNRILILISEDNTLTPVVDQGFPFGDDFGTEVELIWNDGLLQIFQHMGFMHRFNEWGLEWDLQAGAFWERTISSGGILGLGSAVSFDVATGLGYIEVIWDDVDIAFEYSTVYANPFAENIVIDGVANEFVWQDASVSDIFWVTWGEGDWGELEDASMEISALYDSYDLFLRIEIVDDEIVMPKKGEELLNYDHIELWFDLLTDDDALELPDLVAKPWTRKKDGYTAQYAIGMIDDKTVVEKWLPEGGFYDGGIEAEMTCEDGMWIAEVSVPWAMLHGFEDPMDYIPFTLVFSDSDEPSNPRQQTLIATSQIKWAEPFTFGSLVTYEPERIYWGVEPVMEDY